jgi:hypothetical protein
MAALAPEQLQTLKILGCRRNRKFHRAAVISIGEAADSLEGLEPAAIDEADAELATESLAASVRELGDYSGNATNMARSESTGLLIAWIDLGRFLATTPTGPADPSPRPVGRRVSRP